MTTASPGAPHTDARRFSRLLAASCLVVGPLLFLVSTVVDPAWADGSAEYLDQVAAAPDRYQLAGFLGMAGGVLTVVGMLGVIHLLRGPRVTVAQIGASLVLVGSVVVSGASVISIFEAVGAGPAFDRATTVALFDAVEESAWAGAFFWTFIVCLMLGTLVLGIGLFLQRGAAPVWVPVALIAYVPGSFFATGQLLNAVASAVLLVALAGLAGRILAVSDENWGRWTVLPDQGRTGHGAPGRRDAAGTAA